ncbi:MAG TPA: DUF4266 domain-containing protein [Polyangiaceae bacterium]|nr:DUF4266 domain-containing protein [Polyangiaceae bacterium]
MAKPWWPPGRYPCTPALVFAAFVVLSAGCVRVHVYERQRLASWAMADPFADTELGAQYRSKVVESKTGGGLPGTAPGGGCGCTQ